MKVISIRFTFHRKQVFLIQMLSPDHESERLDVLHQYQILDTPAEEVFDELTLLAANLCETPIALISLVDDQREWFKSKVGITTSEVPRSISFGAYTIRETEILIISDILQDQRFAAHPLVICEPYFRAYAGVPLVTSTGFALGSLCVVDFVRRDFDLKEQAILQNLARQVIRYLEIHREKISQDSQNCFNLLCLNHHSPMWVYDSKTLQFLDVNKAAIIHYGYSREEFLQMRITDIRPPEDVPLLLDFLATKPARLSLSGQWRHRLKNQEIIDVQIVSFIIYYAGRHARLVDSRDITEHKRIERNLQQSEARFRAISEAIPVPLIISSLSDGLILYANQEFLQTFRFSCEDLVDCQTSDLYFAPTEYQKLLAAFTQDGCLHNYEIQLQRADNTSFWALASLHALNFNGKSAILKVFYDITDRKNTETKLQEQNEFLQTLFERIPLMIALIDTNGKSQWINHELESVLGGNFRDFKYYPGRDVFVDLYPNPEYRQHVINFLQASQPVWGDFMTQLSDSRVIDTSWTKITLANGQTISIGQDITARKQTERTLKAQAEREQLMRTVAQRIRQSLNLQDILNATVKEVRDLLQVDRVIVFQFSPDMSGKIVAESVETGWTNSLGQQIEDTCFQRGGGLDYHEGRNRAISNIYEAGLTDCHINLLEQFEVKANLVVPILLEVAGENYDSRLWGLLIAHQCSGPHPWEAHQLDLLEQLTVQIAIAIQQSSILQQAQIELAQRQRAEVNLRSALAEKEVLLKEIHHRVKNSLQIVSSLLQLQSQTLNNPELISVFRESQNRIESIALIHKNLYTAPNIGQLNVGLYIHNLATSLLSSYQILPGRITLETQIDSMTLNIDQAIACGLIINELISNAIKHAFPNEQLGIIIIELHNFENLIEMTIQDNGIGLPNDFDWQNTSFLGISLVHDLVTEQLEGTMTVEKHHGTLFKIKFPQSS